MFSVGEKVRFLNEVGNAVVTKILSNGMVEVTDDYGLVTRLAVKELVPAERNRHADTPPVAAEEPRIIEVPKPAPVAQRPQEVPLPELALVFLSDCGTAPETGDLDVYFANNSAHHMLVNIAAKEDKGLFSLYHGEVRAGQLQHLRGIRRRDVDIFGHTVVDCIFYQDTDYKHREAFSSILKLKVTRFVREGSYREVAVLGGKAMVVAVEKASQPEMTITGAASARAHKPALRTPLLPTFEEEVDLHIEQISSEFSGMSDHEMFVYQMNHFEKRLNHGLMNDYLRITFIHGVGTGKLRDEIRRLLREYKLRFEDGPFQKYGVGATVVLLK